MNKRALTVLVISLSLVTVPVARAQDTFVEVPPDASSITYNDAANCSDAQGIVNAAQNAANDRILDVNRVVKDISTETRNRRACIENLMKLLTFAIPTFPSLTAIINQLVQAFIQNLIGKACAAATSAINGAISQVNNQINNVQGSVNQITNPLTNIGKQAAAIPSTVLPDPSRIVREEISASMPQIAPPPVMAPSIKLAPVNPGQAAPSSGATSQAPAKQEASGWKAVSCKIFGGC